MVAEAKAMGFRCVSEYLRYLHIENLRRTKASKAVTPSVGQLVEFHKTFMGSMFQGDSLGYLHHRAPERSVDLILTSPPFGLLTKKRYGNEDAHAYCDWFRPFAEGFKRVLKDTGSLVIDIGGAWKSGVPARSLYHFQLLLMLCDEYGFKLCQEHYWWNPAKLPTPSEWVNIRRIRVKDAVNCVWWLSQTEFPKANNRRILAPYSESMKLLLKNGYQARSRPSGHVISKRFGTDNGGAVPPNLLAVANTESASFYQRYCRKNGLEMHPARFPPALPEYFIRFLTDKGDMVLDPFGGSCVTGRVAESLGRRWVCVELNGEYLRGAMARFQPDAPDLISSRAPAAYCIEAPCSLPIDEDSAPLFGDGGVSRRGNESG